MLLNGFKTSVLCALLIAAYSACTTPRSQEKSEAENMARKYMPPQARKIDHTLSAHGQIRNDPFYWLRERENSEVLRYLREENTYTDARLGHVKPLRETLFQELKGRIKEVDVSVPYRKRGYLYSDRFESGREYPIHIRRKVSGSAPEEVLVDENERAKGHEFYELQGIEASDDNRLVLFSEDTLGRRRFTLRIKELMTGKILPDEIADTAGIAVWAADNEHFFYIRKDLETLRPFQVYRHRLGTASSKDVLVFEEKDETFSVDLTRSKSNRFILIQSTSTLTAEALYLEAAHPLGGVKIAQARERDHLYSIDHFGDDFYFLSNWKAKNFRLMKAAVASPEKKNWVEVISHHPDVLLTRIEIFKDYFVLQEKRGGLDCLRVISWKNPSQEHLVSFEDKAYSATANNNFEMETDFLRFEFTSLTTPDSVYDYNMTTRARTLLKRKEVLGGFDPTHYVSERQTVVARDGARVPVSIVYRKGFKKNGGAPLLLYGYGSYGYAVTPYFSANRLSLLDRGFVFAIAHIRGGDDLGRAWYEDGRQLKKKNTFTDFIDVGEFLVKEGYSARDRLFAMGGSAGGLLMGAVINMRPDLFKGIVAAVPFVDVMTTMLDPSIPLTTGEYDEWGNPNDKKFYDYILSYSPYDNVEKKPYPAMLVTTGLHDSQVQYWEPAKWVAKLRELNTSDLPILLWTEMEAGHGGKSGRFKELEDIALQYVFLLNQAGIEK